MLCRCVGGTHVARRKARPPAIKASLPILFNLWRMSASLTRRAALALSLSLTIPVAALAAPPFVDVPYATWTQDEPQYRLYPGDELDVAFPSAPELNKTVVVQPDGRIMLPLVEPQMAADRTAPQLEAELARAYADVLLRPDVTVTVRAQPLKVFVGGE